MSKSEASLRVTVLIKALNEEAKIAAALQSALKAVAQVEGGGEVILCDSLSTDRTVAIAAALPVRVLQLKHASDRSCGAGAQIGLGEVHGEFVYILDGDMTLEEGFLPAAVARLCAAPELAGVAGLVEEMQVENQVFRRRLQSGDTGRAATGLVCLNMGGLYRMAAVREVGYLTNRNLHAFEEFELGIRLVAAGWTLERLGLTAVRHYGHTDSTFALLWRRWRTRHAWGHGELLRQAWGGAHFGLALRHLRLYHVAAFVLASWLGLFAVAAAGGLSLAAASGLVAGYWLAVFVVMAARKRSLGAAAYSVVAWHINLAGCVFGLLAPPRAAADLPVPYQVLH